MSRGAFRLFNTSAKFESPFKSLWGGNVKQNVTSSIDSRVPFITDRNALAAAHYPVEYLRRTLHKATLWQPFRDITHTPRCHASSFGIPSAFSTSLFQAARKLTSPQASRAENIPHLTSRSTKSLWAAARQSPPVSREPRGSQVGHMIFSPCTLAPLSTSTEGAIFASTDSGRHSFEIPRHRDCITNLTPKTIFISSILRHVLKAASTLQRLD